MNIFQTPIPLIIAAVVVLMAVTIFRRARPRQRKWWQLLLPAIVLLSAFGADFLFRTDYEKIDLLIKTAKEAAVAGDIEQIEKMISPDYRDSSHDSRERIVTYCRSVLSRLPAEKIKKRYSIIEISGPRATAELEVAVHLQQKSVYAMAGNIVFVKLKLYFTKTVDKKWLVDSSQILEVNKQPWGWKNM